MRWTRKDTLLWTICLAIFLCTIWKYFSEIAPRFLNLDQNVYTYTGWAWGQGHWPYVNTWDHKGPVVFAVTLLRSWILDTSPASTAIEMVALGGLTAVLLACLAGSFWGNTGAVITFLLWVLLWTVTDPEIVINFHQTPVSLISLFSTASVLAGLAVGRSKTLSIAMLLAVTAGVFGGLAWCTKPTALAGYLVALLAIAWTGQQRSLAQRGLLLGTAVVGGLFPIAILAAIFFRAGALNALLDCYFTFNFNKGGHLLEGRGIARLIWHSLKSLSAVGLALPLAAISASVFWVIYKRGRISSAGHSMAMLPPLVFVFLWLVLELGVLAMNGGQTYHTQPVLPPTVLVGTCLVQWGIRDTHRRRKIFALVIFAVLCVPAAARVLSARQTTNVDLDSWNRVVDYVAANSRPDQTVFAFDTHGPGLLNAAHRLSSTRYLNKIPLMTRGYAADWRWNEMLQDIQRRPPRFIFFDPVDWEGPSDLALMLDWAWHPRFFRVPSEEIDETPYPSRARFIAFIAQHYQLDFCAWNHCLLKPTNP